MVARTLPQSKHWLIFNLKIVFWKAVPWMRRTVVFSFKKNGHKNSCHNITLSLFVSPKTCSQFRMSDNIFWWQCGRWFNVLQNNMVELHFRKFNHLWIWLRFSICLNISRFWLIFHYFISLDWLMSRQKGSMSAPNRGWIFISWTKLWGKMM